MAQSDLPDEHNNHVWHAPLCNCEHPGEYLESVFCMPCYAGYIANNLGVRCDDEPCCGGGGAKLPKTRAEFTEMEKNCCNGPQWWIAPPCGLASVYLLMSGFMCSMLPNEAARIQLGIADSECCHDVAASCVESVFCSCCVLRRIGDELKYRKCFLGSMCGPRVVELGAEGEFQPESGRYMMFDGPDEREARVRKQKAQEHAREPTH